MSMRMVVGLFALVVLHGCGGGGNSPSSMLQPMGNIVAVADAYTLAAAAPDQPYLTDLFVLDNDTAPPGDALRLVSVAGSPNDSVDVLGSCLLGIPENPPPTTPCVEYRPKPGFVGTDNFTYTIADQFGRTATGQVSVELVDHSVLQGTVVAPAGSIGTVRVGLAGRSDRVAIDANGQFHVASPFGQSNAVLVADAGDSAPALTALLGSFGEPQPNPDASASAIVADLRLGAFSTASYALLSEIKLVRGLRSPLDAQPLADWPDLLARTTLIQLTLEAGGISAALPLPTTIASDSGVRARLAQRFGANAIAQRQAALLNDARLLPLLAPISTAQQILIYDNGVDGTANDLLLSFSGAGTTQSASYVSAFGAGTATTQTVAGANHITPQSGPVARIPAFALRRYGTPGDAPFGVAVQPLAASSAQMHNGLRIPQLLDSVDPPGFSVVTGNGLFTPAHVGGSTRRLPVCALPAGTSAPVAQAHRFNADGSGVLADSGAPFTWLQTGVLSIRYADGRVATFIDTARRADGTSAVVAIVKFATGERLLCVGSDVPQL